MSDSQRLAKNGVAFSCCHHDLNKEIPNEVFELTLYEVWQLQILYAMNLIIIAVKEVTCIQNFWVDIFC